ncbi:hypothetical protein [Endozoicomonas sp. ONNA1]|uniref:hypothetical protein n=1 Tax=Endozoicomonas sp. ONNA1 TaxID=2828740 RepID=UPI0021481E4B|nr:hypothetical protein [Endozoicomonas sp. ONNA1]
MDIEFSELTDIYSKSDFVVLDELTLSLESLHDKLVAEGASRNWARAMEVLYPDWHGGRYPVQSYTELPSTTNFDVSMEGVVSSIFSLVGKTVEFVMRVLGALLTGLGRIISWLSGGSRGDDSRSDHRYTKKEVSDLTEIAVAGKEQFKSLRPRISEQTGYDLTDKEWSKLTKIMDRDMKLLDVKIEKWEGTSSPLFKVIDNPDDAHHVLGRLYDIYEPCTEAMNIMVERFTKMNDELAKFAKLYNAKNGLTDDLKNKLEEERVSSISAFKIVNEKLADLVFKTTKYVTKKLKLKHYPIGNGDKPAKHYHYVKGLRDAFLEYSKETLEKPEDFMNSAIQANTIKFPADPEDVLVIKGMHDRFNNVELVDAGDIDGDKLPDVFKIYMADMNLFGKEVVAASKVISEIYGFGVDFIKLCHNGAKAAHEVLQQAKVVEKVMKRFVRNLEKRESA